jgi:hypothetical protein
MAAPFGRKSRCASYVAQAILQLKLLGRMVSHRLGDPAHFLIADLWRTPWDGFGEQSFFSTVGKLGQPVEHRAHVQPEYRRDAGCSLALSYGPDGLLPHDLQGMVVELATISRSFAFHIAILLAI